MFGPLFVRRPYIERAGRIARSAIPFSADEDAISIEKQSSRIQALRREAGVQGKVVKDVLKLVGCGATDLPMDRDFFSAI